MKLEYGIVIQEKCIPPELSDLLITLTRKIKKICRRYLRGKCENTDDEQNNQDQENIQENNDNQKNQEDGGNINEEQEIRNKEIKPENNQAQ